MSLLQQASRSKTSGMMKMNTEWKDQGAKCEGDAVFIGYVNKCLDTLITRSHVDTLAQVLASVEE